MEAILARSPAVRDSRDEVLPRRLRWERRPDRVSEERVAAESIYKGTQPVDRVDIQMILGVIDDVKKLQPAP